MNNSKRSKKLTVIILTLSVLFLGFFLNYNFADSVSPGGSCDDDEECSWSIYGGGNDHEYTYGNGVEIFERKAECVGGQCQLVSENDEDFLFDCTQLDRDTCSGDAPATIHYSVTENGDVCCEPRVAEREPCIGDRSRCTIENGEAMCQSDPEIKDMRTTNLTDQDYCGGIDFYASWRYDSETDHDPVSFTFQLAQSGISYSQGLERSFGDITDGDGTVSINITNDIDYDTEYKWRVRAEDEYGNDSGWNEDYFEIKKERASVNFEWQPRYPFAEESTHFNNLTDRGGYDVSYQWTFEGADIDSSTEENPTVEFEESGQQTVILEAVEDGGFTQNCSYERNVRVRSELPDWQEIDPF